MKLYIYAAVGLLIAAGMISFLASETTYYYFDDDGEKTPSSDSDGKKSPRE